MKIKVYSLCRSGHHAIAFWLAKNLVPAASVDLTYYDGEAKKRMVDEKADNTLDLVENEHIKSSDEPTIIILRDPYNNYASFLKLVQNPNFGPLSFFTFIEHWKEYAKEAVGDTNLLSNKITISYNDWVSSEDYRKGILERLEKKFKVETKFDDSLKNSMTVYGGGSSFDGLDFVQSANEMKVLERYKEFQGSVGYRASVDTPEIKELSERLFKFYPWKPIDKSAVADMRSIIEQILG